MALTTERTEDSAGSAGVRPTGAGVRPTGAGTGQRAESVAGAAADRPLQATLRRLLRTPLFAKILIANSAIVVLGAVAGTWITADFVRGDPSRPALELVGLFVVAGVVVSVAVNALILRVALAPLGELERTARAVQAGHLDARARISAVADREVERLTRTFNAMLDGLDRYRQRLRRLAERALHAQEEERKRIARELHDETAQTLAALLIRLRLLRAVEEPEARRARLEEAHEEIARVLDGIRRYTHGLRPPALESLGLVPAIRTMARMLTEGTGLMVEIDGDDVGGLLTPERELALYRMVQEALSNVVRHARASSARVQLERDAGHVIATVEDDGRGFEVEETLRSGKGLGLFGMRERAAYVGGQVEIASSPGSGTRVRISIPARSKPEPEWIPGAPDTAGAGDDA